MDTSDEERFPLSTQQRMWCTDGGRAFNSRFIVAVALRIDGPVDTAELQAALNAVVVRHEALRTRVVRAPEIPHQHVYPPCPVPLSVRSLPAQAERSRDLRAEELLLEAEQSTLELDELPLLRAVLGRFDDRDSVLTLVAHHTAVDGWSLELILRDLAEYYASAVAKRPAALPVARPYREYAALERETAAAAGPREGLGWWRQKLDGASYFALPADRPTGRTRRYFTTSFGIGADIGAAASQLAKSTRTTTFMVMVAALDVLAYQITGTTDPVINAISNGRSNPRFRATVGPFLNFLPLRTDTGACDTFREILQGVRVTCLEAYAHEIPVQDIDEALPELMAPQAAGTLCDFIFGYFTRPFSGDALEIGDGACQIRRRELADRSGSQLPGGVSWTMAPLPSGAVNCAVEFNRDEFDESTIVAWTQAYERILTRVAAEPDLPWKTL